MTGWNKIDELITSSEYRYKSSTEGYDKIENNVRIQITVDKNRSYCMMYKSFVGIDEIEYIGELEFIEENINVVADEHFSTFPLSVKDLEDRLSSLKFYTQELVPITTDILYEAFKNEELRMAVSEEMLFVNRVNTISRMYNWEKTYEATPFHAGIFRSRILSENPITDAFGNIKGFGMHFPSKHEFNVYVEFHNKHFLIEDVED